MRLTQQQIGWALITVAATLGGTIGISCTLSTQGEAAIDASTMDSMVVPDVRLDRSTTDSPEREAEAAPPDASDGGTESGSACEAVCTIEGGTCEPTLDGGEQCSIYCNATNPCGFIQCPAGVPCFADCTGAGACSGGVDCSLASSCTVVCGGGSNCGTITCGGDSCRVLCEVQGACAHTIDCAATNSCDIECIAPDACAGVIESSALNTTVNCAQQSTCAQNIRCSGQTCHVNCGGQGSCAGGECCDAGTCNPQAPTQSCP